MTEKKNNQNNSFLSSNLLFNPALLIVLVVLSVIGAIIGIQIITTLGISANTSIIGAILAILFSKLPIAAFRVFKDLNAQNLVQTAISSATFSAANGLLISIGVPWALGMPELIWPMLTGAFLAVIVDGTMLYWMFDTKPFPATAPWPVGVATAETLWAGDKGGKKLWWLIGGFGTGMGGAFFGIPMASFGVALLGSFLALFMFAIGLLIRGYSAQGVIPYDLYANYVPHGIMLGAGLMAIVQIIFIIVKAGRKQDSADEVYTEPNSILKRNFLRGAIFYFVIALFLVFATSIFTTMSIGMLIGFLIFAMIAAITQEMIVGMAAMHSGWFPATAAALISLIVGMLIGFPPEALAVLIGFCVAIGPSFADLGFDFKAGFMVRKSGKDREVEKAGRRLQYFAAIIGFFCAVLVVALTYEVYFIQDKIVPASRLYAATIQAGSSPDIATTLIIWAIPGAILQIIGGVRNQLGIMISTGLMINYPIAGWTVLVALACRLVAEKVFKINNDDKSAFAGGLIAGDAIYSAFKVLVPAIKAKLIALFIR